MGLKYIFGCIDDGKFFGIIWIIFKKMDIDISWFLKLMEIIFIFIFKFVLLVWVFLCLEKVKILGVDNLFGVFFNKDIEEVVKKIFYNKFQIEVVILKEYFIIYNLLVCWLGVFIGRYFDLEVICQWVIFFFLLCLIFGWVGIGKIIFVFEVVYVCIQKNYREIESFEMDWLNFNFIVWFSVDWKGLIFSDFLNIIVY